MIAFAIIDDHNANKDHNPEGNIQPFCKVFGKEAMLLEANIGEDNSGNQEEIEDGKEEE